MGILIVDFKVILLQKACFYGLMVFLKFVLLEVFFDFSRHISVCQNRCSD